LRTKRPYRDPWPSKKVLAYIEAKSGTEFDGGPSPTRLRRWWANGNPDSRPSPGMRRRRLPWASRPRPTKIRGHPN